MSSTAARARRLLVLVCAASAGVHAALAPEHWRESATAGAAFAASAVALGVCAVALDRLPRSRLPVVGAAVLLAGLLGAYLLTRLTAIPPLAEHQEPVDAVGVATKAVEGAGLALAVVASQRSADRPQGLPRHAERSQDVNITTFPNRPRGILPVAAVVAAVSAAIALPFAGEHSAQGHESATHAKQVSSKQLALHDGMRKLWEDHITWTRLAIVSFAADVPDFDPTAKRLLRNQVDIGNAIKPYYGKRAGNRLTSLLKEHITGAVDLLKAAKANKAAGFADAKAAWYRNGDQIARFLNRANPRNWRFGKMRSLMRVHLDDTLVEADAR